MVGREPDSDDSEQTPKRTRRGCLKTLIGANSPTSEASRRDCLKKIGGGVTVASSILAITVVSVQVKKIILRICLLCIQLIERNPIPEDTEIPERKWETWGEDNDDDGSLRGGFAPDDDDEGSSWNTGTATNNR
jgi:hypothetical protein